MEERLYQIALGLIPGLGEVNTRNLIAYCGAASAIFKAKAGHLKKIPGIGQKTINSIQSTSFLTAAEEILSQCEKSKVDMHFFTDSTYPEKLKQAIDAPVLIYSKGNINSWDRVLAVVGTRQATDYGREITERIVKEARELEAVIVSGLAYGIDITAHRAALNAGIPTVAVLAGGLDQIYPSLHKKYAEEMLINGGLISENPPKTQPEAHFFPARNRIIAGMCDAVIVVEAASRGGALITANIADSYNRTVFAVPGDLHNTYSEGCNYLIRNQKALIYTGIADLKYHLNWDENGNSVKSQTHDLSTLNEKEKQIYNSLESFQQGLPIDELSWRTQIPVNQLAGMLLNMEFQGLVKSLPGTRYKAI